MRLDRLGPSWDLENNCVAAVRPSVIERCSTIKCFFVLVAFKQRIIVTTLLVEQYLR